MITLTLAGPKGGEAGKLGVKLHSTLALGGKVVRLYDLNGLKGDLPDPLPTDCSVTIIVNKDTP